MEMRRAIAAGLTGRGAASIEPVLAGAGYALSGLAPDGASALRMIPALQPELVLADAVMPGLDGIAFAQQARRLRLNVQPAILLLRLPGMRFPGADRLEALGAAMLDRPLTAEAIAASLARLAQRGAALPPDKALRLATLLDALGIPRHPGRERLACAVALVWADRRRLRPLKDRLYPEVARLTGGTSAQAERAIRYVIDEAWRTGEIEQQHKIFGDTIDARRGKPTCGEMIAQLADILRWEGRQ